MHISTSALATQRIAKNLARSLPSPCLILLDGDLGAGKTTFVQGFLKGLPGGETLRAQSPTYALARTYPTAPPVHHLDLYRLDDESVAIDLGIEHLIDDPSAFVIIEWSERLPFIRQRQAIQIHITDGARSNERCIQLNLPEKRS